MEDAGRGPETKFIQEWGYSLRHSSPLYYVRENIYLHMASTYAGFKVVHVIYTKVLEDRGKGPRQPWGHYSYQEGVRNTTCVGNVCVGNDERYIQTM